MALIESAEEQDGFKKAFGNPFVEEGGKPSLF